MADTKPVRHRFHALCPYFAMFPESFAEKWIDRLTRRDEVVLDPFCGRGTVPFQAMLMERTPVGNDINPVAFCVTRAKTNAPQVSRLMRRLQSLEAAFNSSEWETQRRKLPEVFRHAYRANTARQLLYLKTSLRWRTNTADCMIAALCLGALHGEMDASHRYLSNQMPRTISTKPSYSIKFWKERGLVPPKRDVFKVLRKAAIFRYESGIAGRTKGQILNHDIRELPMLSRKFARPVRVCDYFSAILQHYRFWRGPMVALVVSGRSAISNERPGVAR